MRLEPPMEIGPRLQAFFAEINPVVIATHRSDGTVHLTPLWYEYRAGSIWINGAASRDWLEHLQRDDRLSLIVVDRQDIQRRVELLGRVLAITSDDDFAQINRLSQRYVGRDFRSRRDQRITVQIEPMRAAGADGQQEWDVTA
jgi:hypothetical protein